MTVVKHNGLPCDICGAKNRHLENCTYGRVKSRTKTFSERSRERCESPKGFNHKLDDWSLSDWMTALTGEVGEAANIVKKLNRIRDGVPGNKPEETKDRLEHDLCDELADIYIYLDLFAQRIGMDLHGHVEVKFQRTNRKLGYEE